MASFLTSHSPTRTGLFEDTKSFNGPTDLSHFSWSFYRLREHQINLKVLIENCLVALFVLVLGAGGKSKNMGGEANYSSMSYRLIGVQIPYLSGTNFFEAQIS